jgi:hypothetical protein
LSNAFWPIAWPSPKPVRLTVFTGVSALLLPVRGPRPEDEALAALPQAEMSPVHGRTTLRVAEPTIMQVTRDASSGRVTVRHVEDGGKRRIDRHGWEFGGKVTRRFSVEADAPTSARIELEGREERGRAGGPQIRIETYQDMTCDETDFVVHARIQAFENDRPVFARTWLERIPRDGI